MTLDRKLTMNQLHAELYAIHRKRADAGLGGDEKLLQLIGRIATEKAKYAGGWGREGTGADMPIRLGEWEYQFSGVLKYITE